MVPKKEVRKYQNDPYSNKQLRDLGYSDRKVQNYPRDGDKNPYEGDGYRIGSYNDPENRDGRDGYPADRGDGRDPRDGGDRNPSDRASERDPRDRGDGRDRGYGYGNNKDGKNRGNDRDYEGENE